MEILIMIITLSCMKDAKLVPLFNNAYTEIY